MGRYATKYKVSTHGKSDTPEYWIWWAMRQRCENPNVLHYDSYGGRGISVCERWRNFASFLGDMGQRPSENHSIDRVDVNAGYYPENCRWATRDQQSNNKRSTVWVQHAGERMSLKQACKAAGVSYTTAKFRLSRGASLEDALKPELHQRIVAGSGVRGAYYHPGRAKPWQAKAMVDRKSRSLGYFATAEEAGAAYQRFIQHARNMGEL